MTTGDIQKKFDQEVLGLCYIVSNLSIAQARAEIILFYADDVELRAGRHAVMERDVGDEPNRESDLEHTDESSARRDRLG